MRAKTVRCLMPFLLFLLVAPPSLRAATLLVTNIADFDAGSLRQAILDANANSDPGNTIHFDAGLSGATITLSFVRGFLDIKKDLTILGPTNGITISGNDVTNIFYLSKGTSNLENLTLTNGVETSGAGGGLFIAPGAAANLTQVTVKDCSASGGGGGIRNDGTLKLDQVVLSHNGASMNGGGGLQNGGQTTATDVTIRDNWAAIGGGVDNWGSLTLERAAVIENQATRDNAGGGGIINSNEGATATLLNVTISGNIATGTDSIGGGFCSANQATAALTNVTISRNAASQGGGLGTYNGGVARLRNTIVADNTVGGDCNDWGHTIISAGYNLAGDSSCDPLLAQATDLTHANPLLGNLQLNPPGKTPTQALPIGSPALNRIPGTDGCGVGVATDQRGVVRPQGGGCDIGAFEAERQGLFLPLLFRAQES